jgi:hypothetical protein
MFFTDGQKESGGTGVIRSDAAAAFYAGRALYFFPCCRGNQLFTFWGLKFSENRCYNNLVIG